MSLVFATFILLYLSTANANLDMAPLKCSYNQFKCLNGVCIDIKKRCDQKIDCSDFSDEANCGTLLSLIV